MLEPLWHLWAKHFLRLCKCLKRNLTPNLNCVANLSPVKPRHCQIFKPCCYLTETVINTCSKCPKKILGSPSELEGRIAGLPHLRWLWAACGAAQAHSSESREPGSLQIQPELWISGITSQAEERSCFRFRCPLTGQRDLSLCFCALACAETIIKHVYKFHSGVAGLAMNLKIYLRFVSIVLLLTQRMWGTKSSSFRARRKHVKTCQYTCNLMLVNADIQTSLYSQLFCMH